MSEAPEVSSATQLILFTAGLSAGIVALWVLSLVVRALLALVRPAASAKRSVQNKQASKEAPKEPAKPRNAASGGQRGPDLKTLIQESKTAKKSVHTKEDMAAHHALFLTTLKGHGDAINGVGWSPDGRLLASACDDLTVRVFDLRDVGNKDPKFRWIRTQQPPLACAVSKDAKEVVAILRDIPDQARIVQYSPSRSGSTVGFDMQWEVPKALDKEPLMEATIIPPAEDARGIAVLLSAKKFGRVYDLRGGRLLSTFEPNSLGNHALAVSAGGRFFAVASFTADVKVWEVEWGREGFKGVPRAMDLKGHTRKVMSAAISPDGTRAATASEDGTLRVWRLDVRYQLQEDPKVVLTAQLRDLGLKDGQVFERMAWGPDGTIAAAIGSHIHFVDSSSGELLEKLHAHDGDVRCISWAPVELAVGRGQVAAVLASCSSDRRVRVWRSPKEADD